jgi:hypothetical protein
VVPYREKAWADTTVSTLLSKENVEVNVKLQKFSRGLNKNIWQFSERLKLQERNFSVHSNQVVLVVALALSGADRQRAEIKSPPFVCTEE